MSAKKKIMSNFVRLDIMKDKDIDYSDDPPTDEEFWKEAKVVFPNRKIKVTMRLEQDVLNWFKNQGRGYQTRINAVLKSYMKAHDQN